MILNPTNNERYEILDEYIGLRSSSPHNTLMILAEGDSHFSIGGMTSNILMAVDKELTRKGWNVLIANASCPGDTTRDVGSYDGLLYLADWDACLLSIGGNDLIEALPQIVTPNQHAKPYVNIQSMWGSVEEKLNSMITAFHLHYPKAPVLLNGYCAIGTQRKSALFQAGPWAGPQLAALGIDETFHDATVNEALRQFNGNLSALAGGRKVAAINTLYALPIPTWSDSLWKKGGNWAWRNEIHPSIQGYNVLASMYWVPTLLRYIK